MQTENIEIPKIKFNHNGDLIIIESQTSSKNDFDFFKGIWNLENKKLKSK